MISVLLFAVMATMPLIVLVALPSVSVLAVESIIAVTPFGIFIELNPPAGTLADVMVNVDMALAESLDVSTRLWMPLLSCCRATISAGVSSELEVIDTVGVWVYEDMPVLFK